MYEIEKSINLLKTLFQLKDKKKDIYYFLIKL